MTNRPKTSKPLATEPEVIGWDVADAMLADGRKATALVGAGLLPLVITGTSAGVRRDDLQRIIDARDANWAGVQR